MNTSQSTTKHLKHKTKQKQSTLKFNELELPLTHNEHVQPDTLTP